MENKLTRPIKVVIGASNPDYSYSPHQGVTAGHLLSATAGSVVNGGVEGVGLDVFIGAAAHAAINKTDLDFHALIPESYAVPLNQENYSTIHETEESGAYMSLPFDIPDSYLEVCKLYNKKLQIVRAGEEMSDRRLALAKIADVVIMINGSSGTLDEAIHSINMRKRLIICANTGGAANYLAQWIMGKKANFGEDRFDHYNKVWKDMLRARAIPNGPIANVTICKSVWDLPNIIAKI